MSSDEDVVDSKDGILDSKEGILDKKRNMASSSEDTEDEPIQSRLRKKKSKTSNIHSSSSEEEFSEDEKKKKKKGTKGKKAPAKAGKGKSVKIKSEPEDDNDVEEGEVSESDGDSSEDDEEIEYQDGYGENLMGGPEDVERLTLMSEREREEEIFRRIENRQAYKRRMEIQRKLRKKAKSASKKGGKAGKKSLTNAVDDTSARSKERRLMVEGKKDTKAKAIEDLRVMREEKKSRAAEAEKKRAEAKPKKRRNSESDDDDEEEPEEEEDLKDVRRKKVKEDASSSESDSDNSASSRNAEKSDESKEPLRDYKELERIRLSRFRLVKWLYLPNFADLVKGFFVRVNFGDVEQGRPVYRIAEILGIGQTNKPYDLREPGSKKSVMTNTTLRLRIFERDKEMNMTFISNQGITEKEFSEFHHRMENREIPLPTRGHLEAKCRQMTEANKYEMTDADITKMVEQKDKLGIKPKNLVMRKAELVKMRDSALRMNDHAEVARIQQELEEVEQQTKERDAPRQAGQVKIEAINRRNQSAAMEALGKALTSKEQKPTERGTEDPFTRRWGGGVILKKVDREKAAAAKAALEAAPPIMAAAPAPVPVKTDPFNIHDFDMKLDIDFSDFPVPPTSFPRRTK